MPESLKFLKGMFKDSGRIDQPDNTYRDALNLIIDDKKAAVANEYGTEYIGELTYTYYAIGDPNAIPRIVTLLPIGTIKLDDNSLIVFGHAIDRYVTNPFLGGAPECIYSGIFKVTPNSKTVTLLYITIGLLNPSGSIIRPFAPDHLNFSIQYPITGEYRLSPTGDILIYFTDNNYTIARDAATGIEYVANYNPPRVFNINKQERALALNPDSTVLYGDIDKTTVLLNVFMETPKLPQLTNVSILAGGALEVGAYYLGLALADEDLTETNIVTVFNPLYVVPNAETTVPYEMITGAPVGTQTNKMLIWSLGNSTKYIQYKYIIPYVVKFSGTELLAYKLNAVETGGDVNIIYTGLEKAQAAAPNDIILDKIKYLAAKSITQLDNKLYMANLVGRKDIGYQRFANDIKIATVVEERQLFDPRHYDIFNLNRGYAKMVFPDQPAFSNNSTGGSWPKFEWLSTREGLTDSYIKNIIKPLQNSTTPGLTSGIASNGYRNPYYNTFRKGYRRGEVYAFYISFVLKDGSETYAYHIPGREAVTLEDTLFNGDLPVDDGLTIFRPQEVSATDPQAYVFQYLDTSLNIPPAPIPILSRSNTAGFGNLSDTSLLPRLIVNTFPDEQSLDDTNVVITNAAGQTTVKFCNSVVSNTPPNSGLSRINFNPPYFAFDYSLAAGGRILFTPRTSGTGVKETAFWRNINEVYPDTIDFDTWSVDPNGVGILSPSPSNRNRNVRHHKMPSNHNLAKGFVTANIDFSSPTGQPAEGLTLSRNSIDFKETVRILGIRLDNIRIPKFILKQIQGYKVYYAKRTQGNKTILGQSLAHPATPYLAANLNNTRTKASAGPFYNIWLLEGHHKIGGVHTQDALWVPPVPSGQLSRPGQYLAQPVIKFHDFNLLRTRSTITPATHIDVQYVITMQNWTGGYKGAMRVQPPGTVGAVGGVPGLSDGTRLTFFTSFRSGSGDDEYAWVHPDLANTINFNATPDSTFYDILGPQVLWGNVYIGAMYNNPGRANIDVGVRATGPEEGTFPWGTTRGIEYNTTSYNIIPTQEQLLNNFQTIFMLDSDSSTYIDGLSILKSSPGVSYKGANYIFNAYGESGIVLGLVSGLPSLGGFRGNRWSYWGLLGLAYQIRNSGSASGVNGDRKDSYLELQHYEYFADDSAKLKLEGFKNILSALIPTSLSQLPQGYNAADFNSLTNNSNPAVISSEPTGKPNVYLVNLCAKKTDVFAPFDEQQLVWTGYYRELIVTDYDTGGSEGQNYYSGASSNTIFGGDTYICKYSYRTTSATFGLAHFAKGKNVTSITGIDNDFIYGDIPFNPNGTTGIPPGTVYNVLNFGGAANTLNTINISATEAESSPNTNNWSLGSVDPFTTVYQVLVESDDNINFRHAGDPIKGVSEANSVFFDKYVASEVLWRSPLFDLTKMDNILYNDHYSAVQDLRVTVPFPKRDASTYLFPNRVIRSQTQDGTFADQYRYVLAFDYKDFAVNKGEITNIFNLNALLYIHTENSLFRTKGKQNLELGDASQAYIGSGDLFAQEPDEFVQSIEGYLGLQNKFGSLVTKDGYIFVARRARKIFMVSDKISDLTELGLNSWARENIPFGLEPYGWDPDYSQTLSDSPTFQFGFIISYDPLFKRTLITKRELAPTEYFISRFNDGTIYYKPRINWFVGGDQRPLNQVADGEYFVESGWTISFSHTLSVWASRHSYTPKMYGYNFDFMYSFSGNQIYEHSDLLNPGNFYQNTYNFEIDCIFTGEIKRTQQGTSSTKGMSKLYSAFTYTADVFQKLNISSLPKQQFDPGFSSYYVYNTTQISGEEALQYLANIRKVDSEWTLNSFRDMAAVDFNNSLNQGQVTVAGKFYGGSITHVPYLQMFTSEGVINSSYINPAKLWYDKKKFVDKFVGIRLIYNNQTRNLINLYGVTAASRVSAR